MRVMLCAPWATIVHNFASLSVLSFALVESCANMTQRRRYSESYAKHVSRVPRKFGRPNESSRKFSEAGVRGANGGVAGEDVRVINESVRAINVQGISNHQLTDLKIVTAGGVMETQDGPVIAILHQYAYRTVAVGRLSTLAFNLRPLDYM